MRRETGVFLRGHPEAFEYTAGRRAVFRIHSEDEVPIQEGRLLLLISRDTRQRLAKSCRGRCSAMASMRSVVSAFAIVGE